MRSRLHTVIPSFDVLKAIGSVKLATAAQYRVGMALWAMAGIVPAAIGISVWTAVADAQGGEVAGFTAGTFAAYFIIGLIVREFVFTWLPYELEYSIRYGAMSPFLLHPLHPIWNFAGSILAFRLQGSLVTGPAVVMLWWLFDPVWTGSISHIAAAIPLVFMAMIVRFMSDWCVGLLAFWMTRTEGLRSAYFTFVFVAGGQVAPLDVWPEPVQQLFLILPYYWTIGFPVELILGRHEPAAALQGAAVLGAWIIVFIGLASWEWRAGIRRYSAVGA